MVNVGKSKRKSVSAMILMGTSIVSTCIQNVSKCTASGDSWFWTYLVLPLRSLFSSIFSCFTSKEEDDSLEPVRVSGDEYFEAVLGVPEEEFRKNLKNRKGFEKDENGNIIMINSKNNKKYCAGKIEFKSLGDIRKYVENIKGERKGKISILGMDKSRDQASEELRDKVDVSCLQSSKKNKDAVFLVASNWNTVESLGPWDSVEKKRITGNGQQSYFDDPTQAPPTRLETLTGTIVCHDLINMEKFPNNPEKWSQTSEGDRQVNLLEGLGIRTVNGYIVDDIENIKKVVKGLEEGEAELENKFKICYHSNQQVCSRKVSVGNGAKNKFADFVYDPNQKIDQIYTAAVSLVGNDISTIAALNVDGWNDYDKLEGETKEKERVRRWNAFDKLERENEKKYREKLEETKNVLVRLAKQVARLNYEAIIKSAVAEGKEKVYLTLLGCGAFENKVEWVIQAISNCKDLIEESGIEVIINISSSGLKNKELYKKIAPLIYDSKGKKVGNFNIFDEQNGNIFDVGDSILAKIEPKPQDKSLHINKSSSLWVDSAAC